MDDKTKQDLTNTLRRAAKSAMYKTAMIAPSCLIAAADTLDTIDNLRAQLAEAQDALQATQRELQSCKDGRAISVDDFIVTFRCEDKGIVGKTNAKIHSVSQHDDGVIEVVIDHWPYSVEIANR